MSNYPTNLTENSGKLLKKTRQFNIPGLATPYTCEIPLKPLNFVST